MNEGTVIRSSGRRKEFSRSFRHAGIDEGDNEFRAGGTHVAFCTNGARVADATTYKDSTRDDKLFPRTELSFLIKLSICKSEVIVGFARPEISRMWISIA